TDAKEAPELRKQVAGLEESLEKKQRQLDELAPFLDSPEGKKAVDLQRELVHTRYEAYLGWGGTALFGLALWGALYYYSPFAAAPPEDQPEAGEPPTHRIT